MEIIPVAKKLPNKSWAPKATRIPLHNNNANKRSTNEPPINPNSSANIAKIKSVCG